MTYHNTMITLDIKILEAIEAVNELETLRNKITLLRNALISANEMDFQTNEQAILLRKDVVLSEIEQILQAQTLERAKYYLARLKKGASQIKTNGINDLNLARWKELTVEGSSDYIVTDSLWTTEKKRVASGAHSAWYHGNFMPQIPAQMLRRYTKKGDWVLDPFMGSGTTLIECKRLGRNGFGIELNPEVIKEAWRLIQEEPNEQNVITEVCEGDSRNIALLPRLKQHGVEKVQLILMHPPYHDIIKFSTNPNDLSNALNTETFLQLFGQIVDNVTPILQKERHLVLVIGDKYAKGEWIPLGFYCMQEIMQRNYCLKSIVVKNFEETRGKRNNKGLWQYRALMGGFYLFKHEYIMIFQKR